MVTDAMVCIGGIFFSDHHDGSQASCNEGSK